MKRPENDRASKKRIAWRATNHCASFRGRLRLARRRQDGRAMLDGWLARGLNPKQIIVLEPQPGKMREGARRGAGSSSIRKARPATGRGHRDRGEAAERARGRAAARALCRQNDAGGLDHGRAHARFPRAIIAAGARDRARDAEYAGGDRPRHQRRGRQCQSFGAPTQTRRRPARRHRQGRMGQATND